MNPTALIAEDEPLLARALHDALRVEWPELRIVAQVGDGLSTVREAMRLQPDILFLDIRMPGLDGLGAAAEIADRWPAGGKPMPQLIFVTAYDEYAVRAFDAQALDYVLKPVEPQRLKRTVERLRIALVAEEHSSFDDALALWRKLIGAAGKGSPENAGAPYLKVIGAGGSATGGAASATLHMVPVDQVLYFEAADKYVRVLTAEKEFLIRTPLKQLLPQLDPQMFWQVHRAVVVRCDAVDSVRRDDFGKLHISLRGRRETVPVSRLYAHLFRAM